MRSLCKNAWSVVKELGAKENTSADPLDSHNAYHMKNGPRGISFNPQVASISGVILFMAVVVMWGFRTLDVLDVPGQPQLSHRWGMEDYREIVYYPVRSMIDGHNPYDIEENLRYYPVDPGYFTYAPNLLLLNLPFGVLPYRVSQAAYFIANVAMIPVLALLILHCVGASPSVAKVSWIAVFIAAGRPVYANLTLGQNGMFTAFGVITALHFARSRPRISGLGFALASVKPTFALPLGLLMLIRRDTKAVTWSTAFVGIACLIPALILVMSAGGVGDLIDGYLNGIEQDLNNPDNDIEASGWMLVNASVALVRLLGVPPSVTTGIVVGIIGLGLAGLAVQRLSENAQDISGDSPSSVIISLAALVAVHHHIQDATLVLLPIVVFLFSKRFPWKEYSGRLRICLFVPLAILWFNYLATSFGLRTLGLAPGSIGWDIATSINSAALLLVFLVVVALAISRQSNSSLTTTAPTPPSDANPTCR